MAFAKPAVPHAHANLPDAAGESTFEASDGLRLPTLDQIAMCLKKLRMRLRLCRIWSGAAEMVQ